MAEYSFTTCESLGSRIFGHPQEETVYQLTLSGLLQPAVALPPQLDSDAGAGQKGKMEEAQEGENPAH